MNDLEINVALAKAMEWVELSHDQWFYFDFVGFRVHKNKVQCSYGAYEGHYEFDYCDPIIFVAICKHWKLRVCHDAGCIIVNGQYGCATYDHCIEKAAALCVIDAVKRGAK